MTDYNKDNDFINFDDYSSNYEEKLLKSLNNIDSNYSYYHSGKAKIAKRELRISPNKILILSLLSFWKSEDCKERIKNKSKQNFNSLFTIILEKRRLQREN